MPLNDDFVPVTGGKDLPASHVRPGLKDLSSLGAETELDRHILRLLALHPELKVRFGNQDLVALDDESKTRLLADMNDMLGIRPLQKTVGKR